MCDDEGRKLEVRYTPRFGKRFYKLADGEATIEGMNNGTKLKIEQPSGSQFWAWFDPVELADAAMGAVPMMRLKELEFTDGFKRVLNSEDDQDLLAAIHECVDERFVSFGEIANNLEQERDYHKKTSPHVSSSYAAMAKVFRLLQERDPARFPKKEE
jgi:hypothetical protein